MIDKQIQRLIKLAEEQLDPGAMHNGLANCDAIAKVREELEYNQMSHELDAKRTEDIILNLVSAMNRALNPYRAGFWLEAHGNTVSLNADDNALRSADLAGNDAIWAFVGAILQSKSQDEVQENDT